jgi:trehalose-phosphatase
VAGERGSPSVVTEPALDAELIGAVDALATSGRLLVASDYDGTLAPLVDDPSLAVPHPPAIDALRSLASLPDTYVALVSGRSLADLRRLSGLTGTAALVGSHGSEYETGSIEGLDDTAAHLLDELVVLLEAVADDVVGARVERKPASVAFHTREVAAVVVADAVDRVLAAAGARPGVSVKHGKDVVELTVVDTDKGSALRRLRRSIGADAVLFVGDDLTDEDAFTSLRDSDVGVKVGPGPTMAGHRVADVEAVALLLRTLAERRRDQGRSV